MGLIIACWDAFCFLAGMGCVWSTQVDMHFVCSLACDGFGQHMLSCILSSRWHGRGFVNTCWDTFCVLAGIGWVWSTYVGMHFVSSLSWEGFGQHMLKYILCSRWQGTCLVNTSSDIFSVLAGMEWTNVEILFVFSLARSCVWLTQAERYFLSSLAWKGVGCVHFVSSVA